MISPTVLTLEERTQVLRLVTITAHEYGATRICRHLADNHSVRTRVVNVECSVGNISDLVIKMINPRIESMGLMVCCTKPLRPFKNKYEQSTGECLWSFYRKAANDANYDYLDADLDELAGKSPGLLGGDPSDEQAVDAWEYDLVGSVK